MLKPFNLAKALAGHAVVDGYGNTVEQFCYYAKKESVYKVYALVTGQYGNSVEAFTESGKYSTSDNHRKYDLFMLVPDPPTIWVNVWKNNDAAGVIHATTHPSLQAAICERITSCSGKGKTLLTRFNFQYEI